VTQKSIGAVRKLSLGLLLFLLLGSEITSGFRERKGTPL